MSRLPLEYRLLGALACTPRWALEIADAGSPLAGPFATDATRRLYETICAVAAADPRAGMLAVIEACAHGTAPEWNAASVTGLLEDGEPAFVSLAAVQSAAAACAEQHRRRKLMAAGRAFARDAESDPEAAEVALRETLTLAAPTKTVTRADHLDAALTLRREGHQPGTGLTTGLRQIDAITRPWRPGWLVVLGARPSVGKSTIAGQIAAHVAQQHGPVALVSLEMTAPEIGARLIRHLEAQQGYSDQQARDALAAAPLHLLPASRWSITRLETEVARLHARTPLRLLVVDYGQLLVGSDRKAPILQQHEEITGRLKALALRLACTVLVLAQLHREEADKTPGLGSFRSSGSYEQDADLALLLYRAKEAEQTPFGAPLPLVLDIAKHRHGPIGRALLEFDGEAFTFRDRLPTFAGGMAR